MQATANLCFACEFLRETLYSRAYPSGDPYTGGGVHLFRPTDTWMGIRDGEPLVEIGTYRTLDACKKAVQKTGGWCGRNCTNYGNGEIANCKPLMPTSIVPSF